MDSRFLAKLQNESPLILDGATGTELGRRGVDLSSPSWTARAILEETEILQELHREYVEAGAEVLTANTFRTHARSLKSVGLENRAKELTFRAVEIARSAGSSQTLIAGSVAPLEDCYSPHLTPSDAELEAEHSEIISHLVEAGVDVLLIETQITIREAVIASRSAQESGVPFCVSFTCNRDGELLSGEPFSEGVQGVMQWNPSAILVNCIPVEEVLTTLEPSRSLAQNIIFGAYANTGRLLPSGTWESTSGELPAIYAGYAKSWKEAGLKLIGGCCGTTPAHIKHLCQTICR